jgi:hypothetical protein
VVNEFKLLCRSLVGTPSSSTDGKGQSGSCSPRWVDGSEYSRSLLNDNGVDDAGDLPLDPDDVDGD